MKLLIVYLLLLFNVLFISACAAQQTKIDTLERLLFTDLTDSSRLQLLNELSYQYWSVDPPKHKFYAEEALALATKAKDTYGIAKSQANLGHYYMVLNQNQQALVLYVKALSTYHELEKKEDESLTYIWMGRCHESLGDYSQSVEYFLKALKISEAIPSRSLKAKALNAIGDVMRRQNRYKEALNYFRQSLGLWKTVDKENEAYVLSNIGVTYKDIDEFTKAKEYIGEALQIFDSLSHVAGQTTCYNTLGGIFTQTGQYDQALYYLKQAYERSKPMGYITTTTLALQGIAKIHLYLGQTAEAIRFYELSLPLAIKQELAEEKMVAYKGLADAYSKQRNYPLALHYQSKLLSFKDSLFNENTTRKIAQLQANYELSKKQAEIELLRKDGELLKKDTQRATLIRNGIALGLLLTLIIGGLVVSRQRLKIQQNRLLVEKNEELHLKHIQMEQQAAVLESQTIELAQQTEKLKEMDELKSIFFANISHEFRTPLTLILTGLSDKLLGAKQSLETIEVSRREMCMMHRNAHRLLQLINQLLDLSKVESGKMKLTLAKGDLAHFFRMLTGSFSSMAVQRQIRFELLLSHQLLPAYFDEDKQEKIFTNLLSNAFKFTPDGGKITVHLHVHNPTTNQPTLEVVVEDNGEGIDESESAKVFNRFYQSKTYYIDGQGTGIGLALTKELVELHGGTIRIESKKGKGSRFIVSMPFMPIGDAAQLIPDVVPCSAIQVETDNSTIAPPSIQVLDPDLFCSEQEHKMDGLFLAAQDQEMPLVLVVEDNEDLRTYIHSKLVDKYRVIESENGLKGLENAIATLPDLIISDWMMPDMDGLQLCNKIKTDERTSHIPIILLTALATSENKLSGLEKGADEYLTKPFDIRELQIRVKNLIENHRKLRHHYSKRLLLQPKDIEVTSVNEKFLAKVMQVVEKNMSDATFGPEEFSREIGMSRMQLHRKLTALTGQSTSEFLRTLRLIRAAQLLKSRCGNVSEIAYQVGFNSLPYFAKCFRQQFGVAANEFINLQETQSLS